MNSQYQAKDHDLARVEKKAFLTLFEDGVLDILMGWVLISFGIADLVYDSLPNPLNSFMGLILFFPGVFTYLIVKLKITQPRIGFVKFSEKRKKRTKLMSISLTIFLIITVTIPILAWAGVFGDVSPEINMAFVFAIIPLILTGIPAIILKFARLFIDGCFIALGMFFTEFFRQNGNPLLHSFVLIFAGIPLVIMGIFYLIRFLQKYSLKDGDEIEH